MADIFISYASEDRERASEFASAFEKRGWSVWWDRNIIAGQSFDKVIEREVESAKSVVVLWSKYSIDSEWVKNEAADAAQRNVLVPAMIDPVKLPLEFRRKQTADLVGWDSNPAHPGFVALCNGVTTILTGAAPINPAPLASGGSLANRRWMWAGLGAVLFAAAFALYWLSTPDKTHPPQLAEVSKSPSMQEKSPPSQTTEASKAPSTQDKTRPPQPADVSKPFFMQRPVTESDLVGKSAWELDVMRNEIYARHGRRFARTDLQNYFDRQPWYRPNYPVNEFPNGILSPVEQANAEFIASYQRRAGR